MKGLLLPTRQTIHCGNHDLLSCGPLPVLDSLDDWRDVRESYLRPQRLNRTICWRFWPRFLQRALSSLLHHYPDLSTGLNAWEYQLLHYVREEGPKATCAIGYTMGHGMDFPEWMADSYLFQRLHHLGNSALPGPLLTLSGDTKQMLGTEVRLTHHGEAILAGKGNAVEWNGIDDWVGGVHLDSRNGHVCFHSEQTLVPGA